MHPYSISLPKCTPFLLSLFRTAKPQTRPAESGTVPVRVGRVAKVLSHNVRVLKEPWVINPLSSEPALHLLVHRLREPLRGRFHVAERRDRRDIHVIVAIVHIHLPLALLGMVIGTQFRHHVEPGETRPVEISRTRLKPELAVLLLLLQRFERVYARQSEGAVVNLRQPLEHVVQLRRAGRRRGVAVLYARNTRRHGLLCSWAWALLVNTTQNPFIQLQQPKNPKIKPLSHNQFK